MPPIAVTGLSMLFPGSTDTDGFWRDILAGKDLITDTPPSHKVLEAYHNPDPEAADSTYCKRGAFLSSVPFDPLDNGLPPHLLPVTDTSQLLALLVARRVLADAGRGNAGALDRERISVILGTTGTTQLLSHMAGRIERPRWLAGLQEGGVDPDTAHALCDRIAAQFTSWQESTFPGFLGNVVAGRISNRLDLGGTNCVVDAACASSLAALAQAIGELATENADLVIVGGADTLNMPLMYLAFAKTQALSRSGDCRPFSDQADGTVLGEGIGMMTLRRLADAERDGDPIYAVIRGLGTSSDGRARSIYAPVAEGQARALRRAYQSSGISPATVELVEAHGTGTPAGDKAEFRGLSLVYDEAEKERRGWCALGSVKSQIGHTKGAAGVAGLFKAVMALHHKVLPPTIKVDRPDPVLKVEESPFYLNTRTRPWVRPCDHPRRAAVSAFGFGGTNYHVVLEEYQGPHRAGKTRLFPSELLVWSAGSAAELRQLCEATLARLPGTEENPALPALARETQDAFRTEQPARLAVVASDLADLKSKLTRARIVLEQGTSSFAAPDGVYLELNREPGLVALLFPGQGSQYVGMGSDLALAFDCVRQVWDEAAAEPLSDRPLHQLVYPRPAFGDEERRRQSAELNATEWAQPALGACSLAAWPSCGRLASSRPTWQVTALAS